MGQPVIYPTRDGLPDLLTANNSLKPARGVFGEFPGFTPKYAQNGTPGGRDDNYRDTMARMFIQMHDAELANFLANIRKYAPDSLELATAIAGTGTGGGTGYIEFFLNSVQMPLQEKKETVEFIGDDFVVYYYGQSAPVWSFSGMLLNTYQDDQANNLFRVYRDIVRGSRMATYNQALRIRYSGYLVTGYMDNFQTALNVENESVCPFSFNMTIKQVTLATNAVWGLAPLASNFDPDNLIVATNPSGTLQSRLSMRAGNQTTPSQDAADASAPTSTAIVDFSSSAVQKMTDNILFGEQIDIAPPIPQR